MLPPGMDPFASASEPMVEEEEEEEDGVGSPSFTMPSHPTA
jgi:hypothetical protein